MKSSKTFNNISTELQKKIPKLKPNETVVFKMLNGVPNPDPDERERSKDPMLYPKVQILTQFRVFDEFQKDDNENTVGGYVDVGCVESWKGDQPQAFRCFVTGSNPSNPSAIMPSRFQGKFELKGGNVRDEELYEVLYLSPQRKDSPCQDGNVEVIFEIQDVKADTKSSFNKVGQLRRALELSEKIDPKKARAILASYNQPNYSDDEVLKAKIQEFARDNYVQFLTAYDSKDTELKGEIAEALAAQVIKHDIATGKVSISGVEIATLKVESATKIVDVLAQFINTADNGKEIMANIRRGSKAVSTKQ